MFIPNNSTVSKLQTAEDLQGDTLLHYDAEMELMNLILLSIPNDIYNFVDACTSAKDDSSVSHHPGGRNVYIRNSFLHFPGGRNVHIKDAQQVHLIGLYIICRSLRGVANPLALHCAANHIQDLLSSHQNSKIKNLQHTSTRPSASTKHKGKEIAKPITPQSESVSDEDSDLEQAQKDKEMNKTEDTTPRYNNDNQSRQFGNQRTMTVAGARETECRKLKRVKDYAYHKEKIMMCKQVEQGVPLQADWLEDTDKEIDEHELEAHYSYMAKIQEVSPEESSSTGQPLEQKDDSRLLLALK
ncbi:hypothetical protein Tco_1403433 [Tanacetum coccineum]